MASQRPVVNLGERCHPESCSEEDPALVWNTLRITEIVNQLRAAGHAIAEQDLAQVSPLMHAHVIPNGTYVFGDEEDQLMYATAS